MGGTGGGESTWVSLPGGRRPAGQPCLHSLSLATLTQVLSTYSNRIRLVPTSCLAKAAQRWPLCLSLCSPWGKTLSQDKQTQGWEVESLLSRHSWHAVQSGPGKGPLCAHGDLGSTGEHL